MAVDKGNIAQFRTDFFTYFSGNFVDKVREVSQDIMEMDEMTLAENFSPRTKDFLLRKRITKLVREQQDLGGGDIGITKVYDGIMPSSNFYQEYTRNPYRLAWLVTPLDSYEDIIEDAAYHGILRMRKAMLTMPLNEKTYASFIKMVEIFNIRDKGVPIQRVQQTNTNVSLDGNKAIREVLDSGQIEEKLKQLREKVVSLPVDAVIADEPE